MSLNLKIGRLGSAIDSATTGHFLSKGATDAVFQAVSSGLDSATITNLVDSAYIQLRDRFQDSSGITAIVDSAYVQARQSSASGGLDSAATISLINNNTNSGFYKYKYTATAGQTVFADSDANGNVMSFDPNSTLVFYNGVLLDETTDYEASSNTVTLTSGADAGVSITVAKYGVGYTPPPTWYGDRAILSGGQSQTDGRVDTIQYWNIASPGNASDFGNLTQAKHLTASFSNATYGVIACGRNTSNVSISEIDYVTISTLGNASDFGDNNVAMREHAGASDATYGLIAGGDQGSAISYVTIATPGNGSDFGDLTSSNRAKIGACSSSTRALFAGGEQNINIIDYVTTATPGNATDFGDLTSGRYDLASCSDTTRGLFAGGNAGGASINVIDYVTMATTSNASDFGDLTDVRRYGSDAGCSSSTRGVFSAATAYSNVIEYVTIQTTGNATDFGDLLDGWVDASATAGNAS